MCHTLGVAHLGVARDLFWLFGGIQKSDVREYSLSTTLLHAMTVIFVQLV